MFIVTDTSKLAQYGFVANKYCENFWTKQVKKEEGITIEYAVNTDLKANDNRLGLYAITDYKEDLQDGTSMALEDFELLGKMLKDGVIKYVET